VLLTDLGVAISGFPGWRMNRASIGFTGAALCVLIGAFTLEEAWSVVDGQTIVLLLAMMMLNANLGMAGFFRLVTRVILARVESPRALLTGIVISSGSLSALFLNDTVVLMLTPLVAVAVKRLERTQIAVDVAEDAEAYVSPAWLSPVGAHLLESARRWVWRRTSAGNCRVWHPGRT
jgi:Na+/H+ antiporter NhaD/arsenite permease-like protein